jgi:hypothetical protein
LNFTPQISSEEGLKRTILYYLDNRGIINQLH